MALQNFETLQSLPMEHEPLDAGDSEEMPLTTDYWAALQHHRPTFNDGLLLDRPKARLWACGA